MKVLERKLVEVLVEQQKKLLHILTEEGVKMKMIASAKEPRSYAALRAGQGVGQGPRWSNANNLFAIGSNMSNGSMNIFSTPPTSAGGSRKSGKLTED